MQKTAYSYIRFSTAEQAKGDSLRRQLELSQAYALKHGFILDESLKPDKGVSAFRGRNRTEGNLAAFLARVKDGTVIKGSALLVESLDRLSREEVEDAMFAFLDLIRSGIEIHTLSDEQVYRRGHLKTEQLIMSLFVMSRANEESVRKSERCGSAWTKKRHNANGDSAISAKVPAWLKAEKGQPIKVRPERVKIIRQIFDWASEGIGQYQICDRLIEKQVPPWGPPRKGIPPRWTPAYIRDILASRSVLGEYQPMTKRFDEKKGRKIRVPDGPLVPDYYPAVVPLSLWQKVQDVRRDFARAKFGETLNAGRNKFSTKNLFRKMVWDVQNNAPMVYRDYDGHPHLVTTHRPNLRSHKISYPWFEKIMLNFLCHADWKEISGGNLDTESQLRLELLAKELDDALKIQSRYESLLDDPESATYDRIGDKYKAASKQVKRLEEARSALEAEISASRSGSELIADTKRLDIVRTDSTSVEGRTKLRLFLAQRIKRIDLTFKAEILASEDPAERPPGIRPGKNQIMTQVHFVNGVTKYAVIDGKKATLFTVRS